MIKGQLSEGLGRGGAFFVCEKCRVNVVWLFTSYRQVKKLCIRETADATGYYASQFASGANNANLARELINNGNVVEVFNKTLPHFLITIIFIKLVCSDSSFTA